MQKFIPILFSTPMVQAIIEGRKTITRRVKGLEVVNENPNKWHYQKYGGMAIGPHTGWKHQFFDDFGHGYFDPGLKCPYGQPGDILWVRETLYQEGELGLEYVADGEPVLNEIIPNDYPSYRNYACCNIPAIHVPKWACRIFLKITNIKVERLHDISPGDACDEGIEYENVDAEAFEGGELVADFKNYMWRDDETYEDYHFPFYANCISSFMSLWEKINGASSLKANPWVWVISFERIEKPQSF